MELKKMMQLQKEFDSEHGWSLNSDGDVRELLNLINKDLIGLFGEIGEFANIIKKLNLAEEKYNTQELVDNFNNYYKHLSEEIIDSLIYILRIATHLNIDLSNEYLKKLSINKERYKVYEINKCR